MKPKFEVTKRLRRRPGTRLYRWHHVPEDIGPFESWLLPEEAEGLRRFGYDVVEI